MGILDTIKRVIRLPTTTPKQYKNIQKSPEQRASEARQIPSIKQSYPEQTNTPYSQAKGGGSRGSGKSKSTPIYLPTKEIVGIDTGTQSIITKPSGSQQRTILQQVKSGQTKTQTSISAYTGELSSREPLSNWGLAVKSSIGIIWKDIKYAFGGEAGEYEKPLSPFEYTSPLIRTENINVLGGSAEQIKFPKMETISGAVYVPEIKIERIGLGAAITKHGETAGIIGGSIVAPELTGGYLMLTGIEKLSRGENVEGVIRFGAGTIPLASELRNIAKPMGDITKIRWAENIKTPAKIYGEEIYAGEKGSIFNIIATKKSPYAISETYLTTATKITGEKTFSIPTIKAGYTKTIVEDWWTGKPIETITKFTTAGKGTMVDAASLVSGGIKLNIPEGIAKYTGTGYVSPTGTITKFLGKTTYKAGDGFTNFGFGGLTKTGEEYYSVAGIKPTAARFYLGEDFGKKTLIGDISQYGLIKRYVPFETGKDIVVSGGLSQITKTAPSFGGFTEQVSEKSMGNLISNAGKLISVSKAAGFATPGFISSAITTEQITKQRIIPTSGIASIHLAGLGQQQKPVLINIPRVLSSTMQYPKQRNIAAVIPGVTEITKQATRQATGFPFPVIPHTPIIPTTLGAPGLVPFIGFPSLPQTGWGEGLGKGFRVGRKFKYSPNIGSVLVGFKMPKMTGKIKFAEMSGFLPRPMIGRTSGSKKKK